MKFNTNKELSRITKKYQVIEISYFPSCKAFQIYAWHNASKATSGVGNTLLQTVKNFKQNEERNDKPRKANQES